MILVIVLAPFTEEFLKLSNDTSFISIKNVLKSKFIKVILPIVGLISSNLEALAKTKYLTLTLL